MEITQYHMVLGNRVLHKFDIKEIHDSYITKHGIIIMLVNGEILRTDNMMIENESVMKMLKERFKSFHNG